jgi:hypothetical protein
MTREPAASSLERASVSVAPSGYGPTMTRTALSPLVIPEFERCQLKF